MGRTVAGGRGRALPLGAQPDLPCRAPDRRGGGWLFLSLRLLAYAGAMAVLFHLFVTGYEEPTLRRRFGRTYLEDQGMVPRWIPRRPRHG